MEDPDATIINTSVNLNVDDILRKYGIQTTVNAEAHLVPETTTKTKISPKIGYGKKKVLQVFDLSDSDSSNESTSPVRKLAKKQNINNQKCVSPKEKTSKKSPVTKADPAKKALLALQKAKRKQEAENKKIEAAKNKEIKKLMNEANKQLKPEECLKHVTAIVDGKITSNNDISIEREFKELGSNYKIESQIFPGTVTWTRKVYTHQIDDDCGTMKPVITVEELPDLLLILSAEELFKLVKEDKLVEHIKAIESIYVNKSVSLGVLALDKQLKHLKSLRGKGGLTYYDVMTALIEVQVFCNCCYRNLDGSHDLVAMICQFTKAIAQRPFKLQQQEKYAITNWYMKGDNKDCVKVDKKGNGLKRLWQQQITSFPLARLETAESIIDKYPTLKSLMEAYDFCETSEKDSLLADIPVRRHAGPMTASRRIGIEMSKKINVFYNSLDGEVTIS